MDPITGAALIGGGSSIGSSAINAWSVERQMRFQERMSNTAHRREMTDLRAAGINPLLTANGSGASSPSGASFHAENPASGVAELYLQKQKNKEEIELLKQQKLESRKKVQWMATQENMFNGQADHAYALADYTREEQKTIAYNIARVIAESRASNAHTLSLSYDNILKRIDSEFYGTGPGRVTRATEKILEALNPLGWLSGGTAMAISQFRRGHASKYNRIRKSDNVKYKDQILKRRIR